MVLDSQVQPTRIQKRNFPLQAFSNWNLFSILLISFSLVWLKQIYNRQKKFFSQPEIFQHLFHFPICPSSMSSIRHLCLIPTNRLAGLRLANSPQDQAFLIEDL